jgi:hypothetical protein
VNAPDITLKELPAEAARRAAQGWRFVTATCVPLPDGGIDLLYHFDRELALEQVRLTVACGAEVPSITPDHPGAYLVENEIQGQFGLRFSGLAPDFGGSLLLEPGQRLSPLASCEVREAKPKPDEPTPDPTPEPTPAPEPEEAD